MHENYKTRNLESEEALIKMKSDYFELEDKYSRVNRDQQQMVDTNSTYKLESSKLKDQVKSLETLLDEIKPSYEVMQRENIMVKNQLNNIQLITENEKNNMQVKMDEMTKQIERMEDNNFSQNEDLKCQLEASQEVISNFEQQLTLTIEKLEEKNKEVEKLKNDLNTFKQVSNDVGNKLARFEAKKVNLESQLEASKLEISKLLKMEEQLRHQNEMHLVKVKDYENIMTNMVPKIKIQQEIQSSVEVAKREWER